MIRGKSLEIDAAWAQEIRPGSRETRARRPLENSLWFLLPSAGDLHRVLASGIRKSGLVLLQGNNLRRGFILSARLDKQAYWRSQA
jgi:hypothetical protein